jgi:hypothetical protein
MQHPDEGTIHSWLDGALSADEAARVEAHVKECPECAAAVAEARGFIAGASRILTALDNAPRGVIPAAAPKKRIDPWVFRIAATVLVVAAGTLVVVRNTGDVSEPGFTHTEQADTAPIAKPLPPVSVQASPSANTGLGSSRAAVGSAKKEAAKVAVSNAPEPSRTSVSGGDADASLPAPQKGVSERRNAMQNPQALVPSGYAQAEASTDSTRESVRVSSGFLARDAWQAKPLKVVGTSRRIGAKVTLYEVAPGDTVTLTEATQVSLSEVVVTGAAVAPPIPQATGKSARSTEGQAKERVDAAAIAKMSDSSRPATAPPLAAPTGARGLSAQQPGTANTVHAITWIDSAARNTLTLTGRMPEARLQEIRIRIEGERARAAAKKSP